jgi:hypothetical protein
VWRVGVGVGVGEESGGRAWGGGARQVLVAQVGGLGEEGGWVWVWRVGVGVLVCGEGGGRAGGEGGAQEALVA